jgi:hypothetical protein
MTRQDRWHLGLAGVSQAFLFYVVALRLGVVALPLFFLALGFVSYFMNGRKALRLFMFLLPLIGATPDLFVSGYPFNYLGVPLFYLAGMLGASLLKGEDPRLEFPGLGAYRLFLALTAVSSLFVLLRWSNLGMASLALLRDTPVAPSQERVSFALIFPAITLALSALAPWAAALLRRWRLQGAAVFTPLRWGFSLSFLLALVQKWLAPDLLAQRWWGEGMGQVNGGFSDFNAFGFFAGAMFLWQALDLLARLPAREADGGKTRERSRPPHFAAGLIGSCAFLAVALAAVFTSGCRTAFLFVLAAAAGLVMSKRPTAWLKAGTVLALAIVVLLSGGTLGKRLQESFRQAVRLPAAADRFQVVDRIGNSRLSMLRDGLRMVGRFPVSGVGAGDFLFYLKYVRFGRKTWLDLPLNQYLLFFCETGLLGGLAFIVFFAVLLRRQAAGTERFVLAAMAVALFFNNFFWFPEVLLLFWVFVAQGAWPRGSPAVGKAPWGALAVLLFATMNIVDFAALHPRSWAQTRGTSYDYGFSYPETGNGRRFRWSGGEAGIYVFPDQKNPGTLFRLTCGAPLARLHEKKQTVDVYWRGKLYRRVVFRENGEYLLRLEDARHREGFLEFRVQPTFILKRLDLGAESRDLGIQVDGPGI